MTIPNKKLRGNRPKAARPKLAAGLSEVELADGFLQFAAGRFQVLAPGEWLFWMQDTGWLSADAATIASRDAMRKLVESRARINGDDEATDENMRRAGRYRHINDALKLVERPAVLSPREDWDANPNALGLPGNRLVDLVSGQERKAVLTDRITMRAGCRPDPACPSTRLHEVLDHMSGGDDELQQFYQLVLGGSLIGGVGFEKVFLWVGEGGSGKSTLLSACKKAAGGYGGAVDRST